MKTKEEILQRLNDLKVEELKLVGKLELLEEQAKQPLQLGSGQETIETAEPSGIN